MKYRWIYRRRNGTFFQTVFKWTLAEALELNKDCRLVAASGSIREPND